MTEEIKPQEGAPTQDSQIDNQQVESKQLSTIEQQALEMGWKPKEQFDGPEDEFIDAKEFVRRKPLFDRLEQQSKQLKQVNKALAQLQGHYTKMREVEFQRALNELKAARRQALTDSDGDRFEAIDEQIKKVEKEADKVLSEAHQSTNAPDPAEFTSWVNKNPWYQKDEAMTAYADRIGIKFKSAVDAGEMTPMEVLQKVENAVRQEFPQKFRNPNKDTAPNVGEGRQPSKKADSFQLTNEEEKIMQTFLRMKNPDGSPFMTKEKYIQDLKKAKGME